jgi:serine protease Do
MRNNRIKIGILVAMLVLAVAATSILAKASSATMTADEVTAIVSTTTDSTKISSPFTEAVAAIRDSIVGVNNYQNVSGNMFGYGFGNGNGRNSDTPQLAATGSGVVITQYGHVLTNYHVVDGAAYVKVSTGDKELDAKVVGSDANLDIAILQVDGLGIAPVALGDSDSLQVGEWAIVIGNPLGEDFARTVTVGVVSALNREVTDSTFDRYGRKSSVTNSMIQVDAAINSGNSGGGMFNILGQLQGIPARKYSGNFMSSTSIDNIGMCIPINVAKPLIQSVLTAYNGDGTAAVTPGNTTGESGTGTSPAVGATRPRIGVTVTTISATNSAVTQGILPLGAYVTNVEANSPAEKAGIKAGDIIVEVGGVVIQSSAGLIDELAKHAEGETLAIKIYRVEEILNAQSIDELGNGAYMDMSVEFKIIDEVGM